PSSKFLNRLRILLEECVEPFEVRQQPSTVVVIEVVADLLNLNYMDHAGHADEEKVRSLVASVRPKFDRRTGLIRQILFQRSRKRVQRLVRRDGGPRRLDEPRRLRNELLKNGFVVCGAVKDDTFQFLDDPHTLGGDLAIRSHFGDTTLAEEITQLFKV